MVNEVLWHDTRTQNYVGRIATRDKSLGGQRICIGDLIVLGMAAANVDPQGRPAEGGGGNGAMMSFGHGEHGCPYPAPGAERNHRENQRRGPHRPSSGLRTGRIPRRLPPC
jgi:hypothetical protein